MILTPILRTTKVMVCHCYCSTSRLKDNAQFKRLNNNQTMPVKTRVDFSELTIHNFSVSNSRHFQLLQACISKKGLSRGKQIHSHITHRGFAFATNSFMQNKLINMYIKCCNLAEARQMFDRMTERDVFSWNTIISAYRRHGYPQEALTLFYQMQQTSVQPDQFTFASILPACAKIRDLEQGVKIHQSIMERGYMSDVVVASALIDMYAKCGSIHAARELFDKIPQRNVITWNAMVAGYAQNGLLEKALKIFKEMPERDVVSWNAMIAGYAQNGYAENALETFKQMQMTDVIPDSTTFASVLPACARMGDSKQGIDIHQAIIETGFLSDVAVASALVDMYAKCGSIHKARELFEKMPCKNVVSWSTMIAGYVQNGVLDEALKLFEEMPQRDVVSWTAIIVGYAQNGFSEKALETFEQMQLAGIKPDCTTFASILPVCAKMGALEQGINIHQSIIGSKNLSDVAVASALVDMYAKCGSIHLARELFDKIPQKNVVSWTAMIAGYAQNGLLDEALMLFKEMPQRDVISWNALIAGYAQNGFVEKALETFKQMHSTGIKPDSNTFVSILPACAKLGALGQGLAIHQSIIESGFLSNVVVASALVDMYAKCGSIYMARELFDRMPQRSVISWNIMIAGYAQNGFCKDALKLFELMRHSGTYPNHTWGDGMMFKW
ncbi:pentatricopeptide repeat-containing protein At2g13600 [Cryptomeria japonica]|uniref:pentatricopeptide repeat-containing protein At2g13600 n=1 Tax=Cryptomeria japonica TaxID=3369 RepID=UPI0027D9F2D2|nr:pentatricopeptide repeat-containing protein At2g13600 [Cryptomeria japonica]